MTFSICVRETVADRPDAPNGAPTPGGRRDDSPHRRFGVAVTTRLPAVGALSPFASENAAVAVQSRARPELGRRAVGYADEGLGVDGALDALLAVDEGRETRQVHGVGADTTFAFTGDACEGWCGHREGGDGDGRYTVAGNLLTGESVVDAVADAYESGDRSEPLAKRLVDALAAGRAAGGDRRDDLTVQSAALRVVSTRNDAPRFYDDLRVDATETPVRDLRETYRDARRGYEAALRKYAGRGEGSAEDADAEGEDADAFDAGPGDFDADGP